MMIEPKSSDVSVVFLGSFNPAIFNPDWLVINGVVGKAQAEVQEIASITPQGSSFRVSAYQYQVTPTRFQVIFESAPHVELQDAVSKIFQELLPHTPVQHLGVNRTVHFSVGSEEKRNAIGRKLAPPEPWGKWSEEWKDRLPPNRSGMIGLSVQERFPGDLHQRRVTAFVQPSELIKDESGIYIAINDHYILTESIPRESHRPARFYTARVDAGLYFRQPVEIGAQHPPLQDKVCELAIAEDLDQGGGLECLDVMGQGRPG